MLETGFQRYRLRIEWVRWWIDKISRSSCRSCRRLQTRCPSSLPLRIPCWAVRWAARWRRWCRKLYRPSGFLAWGWGRSPGPCWGPPPCCIVCLARGWMSWGRGCCLPHPAAPPRGPCWPLRFSSGSCRRRPGISPSCSWCGSPFFMCPPSLTI